MVLLIQQIALIATPALMMGVMLTTSMRKTFSLRWPGFGRLGWAIMLPFALHPLVVELQASLQWFFPKPPPGLVEALKMMSSDALPLWLVILVGMVIHFPHPPGWMTGLSLLYPAFYAALSIHLRRRAPAR